MFSALDPQLPFASQLIPLPKTAAPPCCAAAPHAAAYVHVRGLCKAAAPRAALLPRAHLLHRGHAGRGHGAVGGAGRDGGRQVAQADDGAAPLGALPGRPRLEGSWDGDHELVLQGGGYIRGCAQGSRIGWVWRAAATVVVSFTSRGTVPLADKKNKPQAPAAW